MKKLLPKQTQDKLAEYQLYIGNMFRVIEGSPADHVLEHEDFDRIEAFLEPIVWKEPSKGKRYAVLLEEMIEGYRNSNANATFSVDTLRLVISEMSALLESDALLTPKKTRVKNSKN